MRTITGRATNAPLHESRTQTTMKQLLLFFLPLGLAAMMINVSHLIINGTLARSSNPEMMLAGFALASSLNMIVERPAVMFRQTCSALVRDRVSFRAVRHVSLYLFGFALLFGAAIAYTPFGHWVFGYAFGASAQVEKQAVMAYSAMMFVSIFSGVRCLYQGVIIYKMKTRWMTIGMMFRLSGMFVLSQVFLQTGTINALHGALIFLFGMIIEATVSWLEARRLLQGMPERDEEQTATSTPRQVLQFYNPLLYSSLIIVWVLPILNAMLGSTERGTMAVASFAVAGSLMNLMVGFFGYFHQITLQFVKIQPYLVRKFLLALGFIPPALMAILCFTPIGPWMLSQVLGVKDELLSASLDALRGYLPFVLVFPWLDSLNGIVMSHGETKLMFRSQSTNAVVTALLVVSLVLLLPGGNGALGSLAQSGGILAELLTLAWLFRRGHRAKPGSISANG